MKKFIIRMFIVIAILLFITVFCFDNIKSNSVYYAKHTPHKEGTEPVLMMLVDNLYWIYNPDIEGVKYRFDGGRILYNYNFKLQEVPCFAGDDGGEYYYGSNGYKSYSFNRDFKLTYCRDRRVGKIDIKNIDVEEVKQDIYKIVQPVIDEQTKPLINLQWLFDIVYKDSFN